MAALLELLRPVNGLLAAVAVLVGAYVTRLPISWGPALIGAAVALAAAGAANALNDTLDVVADNINRPDRPIPSGRLSRLAAAASALVCGVAALALAAIVGPSAVVLAAVWLVLTALYSVALKGVPVAGNIAVALVASTPFLMGGLSQGRHLPALIPCALAFLVHLAREVVKDVEDVDGDAAAGVRTLAVRRGPAVSLGLARGILVALIGLAALPFAFGAYGWGYAVVMAVIDLVLVWLALSLTVNSVSIGLRTSSNVLKGVMALGLVAFVVGVLTS